MTLRSTALNNITLHHISRILMIIRVISAVRDVVDSALRGSEKRITLVNNTNHHDELWSNFLPAVTFPGIQPSENKFLLVASRIEFQAFGNEISACGHEIRTTVDARKVNSSVQTAIDKLYPPASRNSFCRLPGINSAGVQKLFPPASRNYFCQSSGLQICILPACRN